VDANHELWKRLVAKLDKEASHYRHLGKRGRVYLQEHEDIVNTVCLKLLEPPSEMEAVLAEFAASGKLPDCAKRHLRNAVDRLWRGRKSHQLGEIDEKHVERSYKHAQMVTEPTINKIVDSLGPSLRRTVACWLKGQSRSEIAATLDMTERTVCNHLRRVQRLLVEKLDTNAADTLNLVSLLSE
jgi:DNA-directed RNA polymerase specialized sigma24 family protein